MANGTVLPIWSGLVMGLAAALYAVGELRVPQLRFGSLAFLALAIAWMWLALWAGAAQAVRLTGRVR